MLELTSFNQVHQALLNRQEIALLDVREEDVFAQAHPLFAANLPLNRIALEARTRIPRLDTAVVVYDDGEGLAEPAQQALQKLGYTQVTQLGGGLKAWRAAGGEVFKDVNVPSKAFGELVESQRHTPSLSAPEVQDLLHRKANVVVLDARRFDEYHTMAIPGGISVPGSELVLRVAALAPDPSTRVIVNCAGRTRSIIGTQSLVNAGIPNPVCALRNGTIGWKLAGQTLEIGANRRFAPVTDEQQRDAARRARQVADRAVVQRASRADLTRFQADRQRTTYCFDVRTPEEFATGHLSGFASAPGGQLVQETDMAMPVRGARVVLIDQDGVRANMSASWLAQMAWDVWVLDGVAPADFTETSELPIPVAPSPHRYRRPYEGTDNPQEAMQDYLDWEYGLVEQLGRDGTHGFRVL
jgi:rhodanese-related sulfurtransferase